MRLDRQRAISRRAVFGDQKKKGAEAPLVNTVKSLFTVTLAKFVDLLRSLQNMLLAGVKRMRLAGNFQFQQWVFVTIFPFDCFSCGYGGAGQDREFRRNILEYNISIFGVNVLFHDLA